MCIIHHLPSFVSLQQYRACGVDPLGLGIICASYITVLQAIPILSPLLFMPSLYSTLNFYINILAQLPLQGFAYINPWALWRYRIYIPEAGILYEL